MPKNIFTSQGLNSILQHILIGIPLAFLITKYLLRNPVFTSNEIKLHSFSTVLRLFSYLFYLMFEMIIAGFDVANRVMRPIPKITPGLIKVRTPLRDNLPITLNANSITLTPGTITIDVEQDEEGSTFWVHSISEEGLANIRENKGFVDKVLNIYK